MLLFALAFVSAATLVAGQNFPSIDFQGLGAVGVAGSFDGIEMWTSQLSTQNDSNIYDAAAATLMSRTTDGTLAKINETESGGIIRAICQQKTAADTEMVYIAGRFSSIGSLNVSNIASYDPVAKVWDSLNGGLDGEVFTLFCNEANQVVYAGGGFGKPVAVTGAPADRFLGAVATWNTTNRAWAPAPFGGLNGTVNQITTGLNDTTLRFTGSFDTAFASNGYNGVGPISGTNRSASALTQALSPLPLGQTEFQGGPASANATFSNPAQILCPQGADGPNNSFLFADNTTGRLTMRAFRTLSVRALRLGNTFQQGRGTKTFSVVSIPDNVQLELLYLDPVTGQNATCTSCPLFYDPTIPYQDFLISDNVTNGALNGTKTMTGVEFTATEWYGAGAGLHQLQLLSDGGWSYAYQGYNRGGCNSTEPGASGTRSNSTHRGDWTQAMVTSSVAGTTEPILTLSDRYSDIADHTNARVKWNVDVEYAGNYSVYVYVPGCTASNQCSQRTDVLVNVKNNSTSAGTSVRMSQNVQNDTEVLVYQGAFEARNGTWMPSVVLSIPSNATAPTSGNRFTVVADHIRMQLQSSPDAHNMFYSRGYAVMEYAAFDPAVANITANGTQILSNDTMTPLDTFSSALFNNGILRNESESALGVISIGNKTFVGGNFTSDDFFTLIAVPLNTTSMLNLTIFEPVPANASTTTVSSIVTTTVVSGTVSTVTLPGATVTNNATSTVTASGSSGSGSAITTSGSNRSSSSSGGRTSSTGSSSGASSSGSSAAQTSSRSTAANRLRARQASETSSSTPVSSNSGTRGSTRSSSSSLSSTATSVAPTSTAAPVNSTANATSTSVLPLSVANVTVPGTGAGPLSLSGNVTLLPNQTIIPVNITFTGRGFRNLVMYDQANGATNYTAMPGNGLNGVVYAMSALGNFLYVGGDFTATADNQTSLEYIARYDSVANVWAQLAGGTNGPVTGIVPLPDDKLLVTGFFDTVNGTTGAGGYGIWDAIARQWTTQNESLTGNMTASDTGSDVTYMAGFVQSVTGNVASGAVSLSAPASAGEYPLVNVLNYSYAASMDQMYTAPTGSKPAAYARRRSLSSPSSIAASTSDWSLGRNLLSFEAPEKRISSAPSLLARVASAISSRSSDYYMPSPLTSFVKRANAMEPASLTSTSGDEILASAFWQRGKDDYAQILGGNFTTSHGVRNLGMYDPDTKQLYAFPSMPAEANLTVVRALLVDRNTLYVGGDGGMQVFDLPSSTWQNDTAPLTASDGKVLSVTAINHRPDSTTIIVAGTFDDAGSLPCSNLCQWDSQTLRWTNLGTGIDGQVAALDFAGNKANTLIVAGSMTMNGAEASLAGWQFDNEQPTWIPYGVVGPSNGMVPGPATAMAVDDLNNNAIFVAGRNTDGTEPYLAKWDGNVYSTLGEMELLDSTGIAQLSFVGITKPHPDNNILENNRLLVVSGALNMNTYGNVSTALFDGQSWTPFLVSQSNSGGSGIVRAFTRSVEVLTFPNLHHLAVGIVILISIAIGLGVVFLLVLLGLIWALARRQSNRGVDVPISPSDETLAMAGAAGEKKRPSSLLATLNAATENVMHDRGAEAGAGAAAAAGIAGVGASSTGHGHGRQDSAAVGGTLENSDETGPSTAFHSDGQTGQSHSGRSNYYSGDEGEGIALGGPSAAAAAGATAVDAGAYDGMNDDGGNDGIEAHARYSFEATHPSELAVRAGEKIYILDDQDEHWWLARNDNGTTGVLPATYVL